MAAADSTSRGSVAAIAFPPDCEEVVRALWDYLDHALDAPKMAVIDAHLAKCAHCREHARFERALIDRIRGLRREHHDPAALRIRVLAALREAKLAAGEPPMSNYRGTP